MYYKCCVSGCSSTRQTATLHRFPTNKKRLNLWLKHLNDENLVDDATLPNLFVCEKHFEKRFIGSQSRLLMDAYPSLLTPEEISCGIPIHLNVAEYLDPLIDHSYTRKRRSDHTYCKDEPSTSGIHFPKVRKVLAPIVQNVEDTILYHDAQQSNVEAQPSTSSRSTVAQTSNVADQTALSQSTASVTVSDAMPLSAKMLTQPEVSMNTVRAATPTGKTVSRKRLIHKIQKLSPVAKRIYKEYKRAKNESHFLVRAKRALKFSKEKSFETLASDMNPYAKKFLFMQIKLCKKQKKGRRFSLDEKLIALAIMKQSPKCYRFLSRIFILPSISTLNKMVSKINIEAGINPKLFQLMKKEATTWKENKKYCSIIFDEMSLGTGLSYDHKKDKINGFVELNERKGRYADHVLVFMLRGAIYKWQQPLAYYFCEGATSGPELKKIIKDVVEAVIATGLKPLVLGCDQGSAFQSAIKSLLEDTRRNQILHNEQPDDTVVIGETRLNVIYDPSHLIKGMRNNFLNKNIKFEGKLAKWQDIVDVYKTDCQHTQARLLHKLNDEHVIPEKIKKMKVKNCVRVLSKTTSAALSYTAKFSQYVDGTPVSSTMKNTAEVVNFLDDLFDSINGASTSLKKCKGKILKTAVQEESKHHEFWLDSIKKLENMRFVNEKGEEKYVPTLKNFVTTLKSYIKLWQVLKSLGIEVMRPRYFNTDPIENFFGQVRAYNYRNNDPTCHNFINTYKSLTITRVIKFHSDSYNCEEDLANEQLLNLQSLFSDENKVSELPPVVPLHETHTEGNLVSIIEQARRERLNTHSKAYTTGWVVRKILNNHACKICRNSLTSPPNETLHQWVNHRDYKFCKKQQKLCYPSEKAVRLFGTIIKKTNEYLEQNAHEFNIRQNICERLINDSMDVVDCVEHQAQIKVLFIEIVIRFTIYNWTNIINKILKGVDIVRLNKETLPNFQKEALEKYMKRIKNRSFNK